MGAIAHHPAFEFVRSREIPNLQLTVQEFRHLKTGAMHFHLDIDHAENVFLVAFRTVPQDSTGVAHILEHTTLCGSEKYPVRDPFFLMIRRSLNTFMNAFTASDYTAYPFASENKQDFRNLLDIYLDAVFFPLLEPLDFAQEGHRLEFEKPDNPDSNLVYKGVVYNEMKGDQSSTISMLYEAIKSELFPTSTYHFNSGGEPSDIPKLTHEQLVEFHKSHYHPSNAIFMTFGDIDAQTHQACFENQALCQFSGTAKRIEVKPEIALSATKRVEAPYPVNESDADKKSHVVMGWKLDRNTDLETLLKCNLLSDVLLDTSASPLRLQLENTPLATAPSPLCGLEETNFEMSFYCGVEGADAKDADAIEALILQTLSDVAEQGVSIEQLEACLHQLELSHREVGGDGYPYGLQLMFSCLAATIHRSDPIALLDLDQVLEQLREEIQDPNFIPELIQKFLLNNTHRVRLTFYPDENFSAREEAVLQAELETTKQQLSPIEVKNIIELSHQLEERQAREEPVHLLPKVSLSDIGLAKQPPAFVTTKQGATEHTQYLLGTNGLSYQQIFANLPLLDGDLMQCLQLYSQVITEIGSGSRNYLDTQGLQHSISGGIGCYSNFRPSIDDPSKVSGKFVLSSRCLSNNAKALNELLADTWFRPAFSETSRISDLISQMRIRRDAGLANNGHGLAMAAAGAWFRPLPLVSHFVNGLEGVLWLRSIDDAIQNKSELEALIDQLVSLNQSISNQATHIVTITEKATDNLDILTSPWSGKDSTAAFLAKPNWEVPQFQAWRTTTQVNHCAQVHPTVPECHEDAAALSVLAGVLRNGHLHSLIREQGGAYGGGATHDAANGLFRFYSYRDPNLSKTFDAFEESIRWVLSEKLTFSCVEEAILGIVSGLDAPASPAGEAKQHFQQRLFGRDGEHRQAYRSRVISTTVEDVKRVADSYLTGKQSRAVVTDHKTKIDNVFVEKTV